MRMNFGKNINFKKLYSSHFNSIRFFCILSNNYRSKIVKKEKSLNALVNFISFEKPKHFEFLAGQSINVIFAAVDCELLASFSLISEPSFPLLKIAVKETMYEPIQWLVHQSKIGDELIISDAFGDQHYPSKYLTTSEQPLLLMGGGIGITPIIGIVEYLICNPHKPIPVHIIHQVRTISDLVFHDRLYYFYCNYPQVQLTYLINSHDSATQNQISQNKSNQDQSFQFEKMFAKKNLIFSNFNLQLVQQLNPAKNSLAMIWGPQKMVETASLVLKTYGIQQNKKQ